MPCVLALVKLLLFQFQIFTGNSDRNTEKKNIISDGLLTRWLRLVAYNRHNVFCLRTEVFGVKQKPGKPNCNFLYYYFFYFLIGEVHIICLILSS